MTIKLTHRARAASVNGGADVDEFHPMKGPMTTQTLRGLANSGPMHWRGDRSNGFFGVRHRRGASRSTTSSSRSRAWSGRATDITPRRHAGVHRLRARRSRCRRTRCARSTTRSRADQRPGRDSSTPAAGGPTASRHHRTSASTATAATRSMPSQGFFGTNGDASFENEEQIVKIAHLRNLYQKVGMFGMPACRSSTPATTRYKGDQIRGFGFLHDGSIDTVFRFLQATVFNNSNGVGFDGAVERRREAPADGAVHARLRHRPGADRRPAGDARRTHQRRGRRSAHRPADPARRRPVHLEGARAARSPSATWS